MKTLTVRVITKFGAQMKIDEHPNLSYDFGDGNGYIVMKAAELALIATGWRPNHMYIDNALMILKFTKEK